MRPRLSSAEKSIDENSITPVGWDVASREFFDLGHLSRFSANEARRAGFEHVASEAIGPAERAGNEKSPAIPR
jgi:hypothetical protein